MILLDDHMFNLWKTGIVDKEEIILRANQPDALAAKVARAERGFLEDEEDAIAGGAKTKPKKNPLQ